VNEKKYKRVVRESALPENGTQRMPYMIGQIGIQEQSTRAGTERCNKKDLNREKEGPTKPTIPPAVLENRPP